MLILSHQDLITQLNAKILLKICPSVEAFIWPQNQPKSGQNPFEIGSSRTGWGGVTMPLTTKQLRPLSVRVRAVSGVWGMWR